ncbi:MAG: chemotaxis protein CheW [Anaerolineae bacterium]|jgi:purine-binding chemotaxis protein CheW
MEESQGAVAETQVVVFQLAGESYGVDIAMVQEIRAMSPITAVPKAPAFVEGVVNLRGQITPVINLHTRFGMPPAEYTKETRIVVVNMDGEWVGLIVDGVSEVVRLEANTIEEPSALVCTVDSDFVRGIAKVSEERLIILLDLPRLLQASCELVHAA